MPNLRAFHQITEKFGFLLKYDAVPKDVHPVGEGEFNFPLSASSQSFFKDFFGPCNPTRGYVRQGSCEIEEMAGVFRQSQPVFAGIVLQNLLA
jgi:hypothetical protein